MSTRKKIFVGSAALLALALIAAYFCRQPLVEKLVDWRVQKNLATYRHAADTGDWGSAHRHAMAAHQLDPRRLDSLLALLTVGTQDESPHRGEVAVVAVRVLRHPAAAAADKAMALKLFLDAGDGVVFHRMFRKLKQEEQRMPEILPLYATYLGNIGEITDAAKILEILLARTDGKDQQLGLRLAAVLSRGVAGNQGVAERMQRLIIAILNGPDRAAGLRALEYVQAIPPEQWQCAALLQAADWVDDHVAAAVADRLTIISLRIRQHPAQRNGLIDQAISRFSNHDPVILAGWLTALNEYDRALQVLPETSARQSPDAYVARAQILHKVGRLSDAEKWLQTPCQGLRPSIGSTLRALVASDAGAKPNRWWEKALQQAELEATAETFWRISASAAAVGNREIEMRAAVEALKLRGAHPSVNELGSVIAWLYMNDNIKDLRQVFQTLIHREPESPMLRNNLAYLEIITGRLDDGLVRELQSLRETFPDFTEFTTSLAVARIALGEYQIARDLLESAISDWNDAPASTLAAYAVACEQAPPHHSSSGKAEEIEALRTEIQWHEMLEKEREFFQSRLDTATLSSLGNNE